jgi:hypothetical protein
MTYLLTQVALGRMILHSICICRGGRRDFHSAGIRREFRKMFRLPT